MRNSEGWRPRDYRGKRPTGVYTVGLIEARQLAIGEAPTPRYQNERFLLIYKAHPDWQKGRYNAPGGRVEDGEWPRDCVKREVFEETKGLINISGLPGPRLFCILHSTTPSDEYRVCYFYHAWADLKDMYEVEARSASEGWPEPFKVWRAEDLLSYNAALIYNSRWLVQMARNINIGAEWANHFEVFERYENEEGLQR